MKSIPWQTLAVAGGLLVAVSVAIPGGQRGGGGSGGGQPLGVALDVHLDANGEINALLDVDPGVDVRDVVFSSPNDDVRLALDVVHEDGVWSTTGTTLLPEGCFTVSAEVLVAVVPGSAPVKKLKKPKKASVPKPDEPAKHKKSKKKGGTGTALGTSSFVLTTAVCVPEDQECPVCEEDPHVW